ncbi:MAG: pyridoxal phosphate-dependent aminotransferase [Candidatus Thermoplasmatota archaeon]
MAARRMSKVRSSGTLKMGNLVKALRAKGEDVISFTMGEPDFDTPQHIKDAAAEALRAGLTHYGPSMGIPEMRAAVAAWASGQHRVPCTPEDVLITPAKHAIFMSILAHVDDGDEVILPEPAWVSYEPCVSLAGGRCVPLETREEEGFQVLPEALAELLSPKTRMVILNTPSNPTGAVLTEENLRGVADLANDHDLIVLSDEIYERIVYEGAHCSIASLDGMAERTITVSGLSKSYAMTGWRIGWLIAPSALMAEISKLQEHSLTCVPVFVQKAGVAALTGPQAPVKAMVEEFRARRDLMLRLIGGSLHCPVPHGAFYLFPSYEGEQSSEALAERLLREAKVATTPGSAFGKAGEGHLRLSYAASKEDIQVGIERLASAFA